MARWAHCCPAGSHGAPRRGNYADGHLAYKNTMANALAAGVKRDVFRRKRRYDSSLKPR